MAAALGAALAAAGCGGGGGGGDQDAGTDTWVQPDTSADTWDDTRGDTAADTDGGTPGDVQGDAPSCVFEDCFVRYVVDDGIDGPAYVAVADVDGDGQLDLVVSSFGGMAFPLPAGQVRLYEFDVSLAIWSWTAIAGPDQGIEFPNWISTHDVDGDSDLDVIVPAGFLACTMGGMGAACGGLSWFEQDAGSWARHDIVTAGSPLFYHHAEIADLDGDGIDDLLTVGEEQGATFPATPDRAVVQLFRGAISETRFETTPLDLGLGLGSVPVLRDMDGDLDLDIASAEYFVDGGSFAWMEQVAPPTYADPGSWTRWAIAGDVGPSVMLAFVPDLHGDGVDAPIGSNHVNELSDGIESAVFEFEVPADPRLAWPKWPISTGIVSVAGTAFAPMAAPGIFGWGDVDGDGDVDLAVSGDGDKRIFVIEQIAGGSFVTHVIEEGVGQAGGMQVTDLDRDGRAEIVATVYENDAVYVYEYSP